MKVKCKVCGEWFEKENLYCDHCASKYGTKPSQFDVNLFENQPSFSEEKKDNMETKTPSNDMPKLDNIPELESMPELDDIPDTDDYDKHKKKNTVSFFIWLLLAIIFSFSDTGIRFIHNSIEDFYTSFVYENEAVEIVENTIRDYSGDVSMVSQEPLGIYEGYLSTDSYLNFDTKDMRFDVEHDSSSDIYMLPIFITLMESTKENNYYVDVWDQHTLKTLGTYIVSKSEFTSEVKGAFSGNPSQSFYDKEDTIELKATYDDYFIEGRLILPYTTDHELSCFDFLVSKINDDNSLLINDSFLGNEHFEAFESDDSQFYVVLRTFDMPQGHPHCSMYYDGVLRLSDGDETYPPVPFYVGDNGEIQTDISYINSPTLTIKDKESLRYLYCDWVDTQFYVYSPVNPNDTLYDMNFSGVLHSNEHHRFIEGSYSIYNSDDGKDDIHKTFTIKHIEQNTEN